MLLHLRHQRRVLLMLLGTGNRPRRILDLVAIHRPDADRNPGPLRLPGHGQFRYSTVKPTSVQSPPVVTAVQAALIVIAEVSVSLAAATEYGAIGVVFV